MRYDKNPNGAGHRGFGFVHFEDLYVMNKVIQTTHIFGGNTLNIGNAIPRIQKFFVGGILKAKATKEDLESYFEQFGDIEECFVHEKGFAFVTMVDTGENLKLIRNNGHHEINGHLCEVKLARPRKQNNPIFRGMRGGRVGWPSVYNGWPGYGFWPMCFGGFGYRQQWQPYG